MKILCINFKGGVGKSTTAIHVAGVLSLSGNTLVVDGDRQVNSYVFFYGDLPQSDQVVEIHDSLSVVTLNALNPASRHAFSERISKIGKLKFDNFVFDTTPDAFTAAQIISEIEPDLIFIPVKYDDQGGLLQLLHVFNSINSLLAMGINPEVKIVPIGIDPDAISPHLPDVNFNFSFTDVIPAAPELFGNAVFKDRRFVWNYLDCGYLYSIYSNAIFN
jgi:chromosome partitioning protein